MENYDAIIIGGGPAGYTAGIYLARAARNVLLIEGIPGGQAGTTDIIENYPGFTDGISGAELMEKFKHQAARFGLKIKDGMVDSVRVEGSDKIVKIIDREYVAKALVIATGADANKLGVPGEEEFRGKGVSYCATCDGAFFKGVPIVVVGGGDSAVKEAVYLTQFGSKVYIVHRRDKLRAEKANQEMAFKNEKIEFVWDTIVEEIVGDKLGVTGIKVKNVKTEEEKVIDAEGVFIYVGVTPNTAFLGDIVEKDEQGYIITNENMETNVPGIYAAGDCRGKLLYQVATAVGDAATAAIAAEEYLERLGAGQEV